MKNFRKPNFKSFAKKPVKSHVTATPAKPSMVRHIPSGELMYYDKPNHQLLSVAESGQRPTVFTCRRKAQSARWHHVMQSGEPMSHNLFEVVDAIDS
jgi:hypothetical protein